MTIVSNELASHEPAAGSAGSAVSASSEPAAPRRGLSQAEARERLQRDGANELVQTAPPSALQLLWRQFRSPVIGLLLAACALSAALAEHFPSYTAAQLGSVARVTEVLVQLPPRGCWKPTTSTAVAYDFADRWLGAPLAAPDVPDLVRRYLRAFGPATAADVTTWSGITKLVPVLKAMDDLVRHEDEDGKERLQLSHTKAHTSCTSAR